MWRCDHVTTSPRTCSPAGLSDSQGTVGSGYLEASSAADWEDEAPQESATKRSYVDLGRHGEQSRNRAGLHPHP
jgi:hypothetical protein